MKFQTRLMPTSSNLRLVVCNVKCQPYNYQILVDFLKAFPKIQVQYRTANKLPRVLRTRISALEHVEEKSIVDYFLKVYPLPDAIGTLTGIFGQRYVLHSAVEVAAYTKVYSFVSKDECFADRDKLEEGTFDGKVFTGKTEKCKYKLTFSDDLLQIEAGTIEDLQTQKIEDHSLLDDVAYEIGYAKYKNKLRTLA